MPEPTSTTAVAAATMAAAGVSIPDNPATKNGVSGQTFGGFRPQDCPQGASNIRTKEAA